MATIPDPKSLLWIDPFDLLKEGLLIKKTPALTYFNQCWNKNVEHILKNKEPTDNIPYYWATNRGKGTLITDSALKTTNGAAGKYLYLSKKDAKDIFSEKYHMESAPIFMDRISIKTDIDIKVNGKYSIVSNPEVVITPAKTNTKKGKNVDVNNLNNDSDNSLFLSDAGSSSKFPVETKKGKNVNVNNLNNDSDDSLFLSDIDSPDLVGESSIKSPTKGTTTAKTAKTAKKATPAKKGKESIPSEMEEEEDGGSSTAAKEKPGRGRPRLAKKQKYIRDQWAKSRKRKKTKREYLTKWERNNNPAPEHEYSYDLTPKYSKGDVVTASHPDTHAFYKAVVVKWTVDDDGVFNRRYNVKWEDDSTSNISQQCIKGHYLD